MNNSGESDVLVVGDSCMDRFTYGVSERLCPDIPVPVFKPKRVVNGMGMAGNLYKNLEAFGVTCDLLTNVTKVSKNRFIDLKTNHTFLRVDENDVIPRVPNEWLKGYDHKLYKAVVIADYGKGFLEEDDIQYLCENNENVFLDTKKTIGDFCSKAKFIKINEPEYLNISDDIDCNQWVEKLIVTLGNRGCMLYREQGFCNFEVERVEVYDVSGAGDTFHAALVHKYLETQDVDESIKYANICATQVVQKKGVAIIENNPDATT
jgi:D-beta-D-heptose 7-phosphate kinase/D-beta-D-heptose 1-phosphate adenosyltransferase